MVMSVDIYRFGREFRRHPLFDRIVAEASRSLYLVDILTVRESVRPKPSHDGPSFGMWD
jgi:hypothetical protein